MARVRTGVHAFAICVKTGILGTHYFFLHVHWTLMALFLPSTF